MTPDMGRKLARAAALAAALAVPGFAAAQDSDFAAWLTGLREEALSRGIRAETLDVALAGVELIPRVVELDRNQPEVRLTLEQYLSRVASDARVTTGKRLLNENRALLEQVAARYGVQPRFVVAFWAIESDFGRDTGSFPVIPALATLAYDPRRSGFFRGELLAALKILDDGDISPEAMLGSWAGAMGQTQFLPSSFLRSAVDFDGDGRRDIWTNRADALASAANHLHNLGWRDDQTWGREVRLPAGFNPALSGLGTNKQIAEWQALGVRRADGSDLPRVAFDSSIVIPVEGTTAPAYLVYDNYRTILRWNRSVLFGLAVGSLADRIGDG